MAKVAVYNLEGKKIEDLEVSDAVFGLKLNNELLHQVFMIISGNQRNSIAHTKGKGEVAGSGKKPFRQKGTGNARQGQKRNPVMKGGGVSFGPTKDRNFKRALNKKMKSKALCVSISDKLNNGNLIAVDSFKIEKNKTKIFAEALKNLDIKGKILVSFLDKEKDLILASRNIRNIKNIMTKDLNVMELLNNKYLLVSKDSIKYIEDKYKK
ncbi:MAG TPA: 50S ribosomal protein L4 [Candidatus Moranbacteria bacterium]|nr:50S ribosomal protein L4 [Candidatus Moranbacteria bacterium]HRZ33385.1 50S ribosomal protein L4 [Candidatus Moranbacteria bacterium]